VADGHATSPASSSWRTARLHIEQLGPEHAEALFQALDDPRVGAYIGGPVAESATALADRIRRQAAGPPADRVGERWWNFLVTADELGTVGTLQVTRHGDWAEFAYLFAPRAWGRGLATEGLTWLVEHCRSRGVREMWATTDRDNRASVALLERCGFAASVPERRTPDSYDPGDLVFVRELSAAPA
jgi:RimJ/RimL family protein N-acetyltransferase